jgi:hypothetical protein
MKKFLTLILLLASVGCSKEIDRVTVIDGKLDDGFFTINEVKPTEFWADIDVKYVGDVALVYEIKVMENESAIFECTDDAMNVSMRMFSSTTTINDRVQTSYQGKLKCTFTPERTGRFKITIHQKRSGNFKEINKSDLIIKQ